MNWILALSLLEMIAVYAPVHYYSLCLLFNAKCTRKGLLRAVIANAAVLLPTTLLIPRDSPVSMILGMALQVVLVFFAMGKRSWSGVICSVLALAFSIFIDAVAGSICFMVVGVESTYEFRLLTSPYYPVVTLVPMTLFLLTGLIAKLVRRVYHKLRGKEVPMWLHIARPAALLFATIGVTLLCAQRIRFLEETQMIVEVFFNYTICAVLCIISATYIAQDIRYISLKSQNKTLTQQQKVNDALVSDMRTFRHNIGNMLYGFEGAALSGDVEEIRQYYRQMSKRCALINNENIYSLQKIPDVAVSTLLLSKLDRAREKGIPFTINLSEGLTWKAMRSSDLCEALGVLCDNAIEAACESEAPHIAMYISNLKAGMEMMISNTFGGETADLRPGRSGKKAHEGLGLKSVYRIAQKHKNLTFNQYQAGRFVQSILLIGG